jgi:serine/threonine-protein kinase
MTHLRDGVVLHRRYTIHSLLGRGAFSFTYRALDTATHEEVAIKEHFPLGCLRRGLKVVPAFPLSEADYAASLRSFMREADLLAQFDHEGIVRVFGSFEQHQTAYLVMELLGGQTLEEELSVGGPMSQSRALRSIRKIASALDTVHEKGLVHGDVKPANIVRVTARRLVLIDFGTARCTLPAATQRITAIGTEGYCAPELYSTSTQCGPWSDVYALGATLYQMLVGHPPPSVRDRIGGAALQPPCELVDDLPRHISDAICQALELDARLRPQSVADFMGVLVRGTSERVPPPDSAAAAAPPRAPVTQVLPRAEPENPRRLHQEQRALLYAVVGALSMGAVRLCVEATSAQPHQWYLQYRENDLSVGLSMGLLLVAALAVICASRARSPRPLRPGRSRRGTADIGCIVFLVMAAALLYAGYYVLSWCGEMAYDSLGGLGLTIIILGDCISSPWRWLGITDPAVAWAFTGGLCGWLSGQIDKSFHYSLPTADE